MLVCSPGRVQVSWRQFCKSVSTVCIPAALPVPCLQRTAAGILLPKGPPKSNSDAHFGEVCAPQQRAIQLLDRHSKAQGAATQGPACHLLGHNSVVLVDSTHILLVQLACVFQQQWMLPMQVAEAMCWGAHHLQQALQFAPLPTFANFTVGRACKWLPLWVGGLSSL